MNLTPYLEAVRDGVTSAAALGDDATRQVAERLAGAVEASTRLALIQALSDGAAQMSAEVAPTSVELRMSGPDPELVVIVPMPGAEPTLLLPQNPTDPATQADQPGGEDEAVARVSLRLPASVKAKVDQMADRDGISTNAWLLRAILTSLGETAAPAGPPHPDMPARPAPRRGSIQGWVR